MALAEIEVRIYQDLDPFLGIDPQNIEAVMIAEKDLKSIEISEQELVQVETEMIIETILSVKELVAKVAKPLSEKDLVITEIIETIVITETINQIRKFFLAWEIEIKMVYLRWWCLIVTLCVSEMGHRNDEIYSYIRDAKASIRII